MSGHQRRGETASWRNVQGMYDVKRPACLSNNPIAIEAVVLPGVESALRYSQQDTGLLWEGQELRGPWWKNKDFGGTHNGSMTKGEDAFYCDPPLLQKQRTLRSGVCRIYRAKAP